MELEIYRHGGADGVTGSCHELVGPGGSVLVDCGLFQGAEASAGEALSREALTIGFDVQRVRALVVTHAHLDHVGRIPYLFAAGFQGPVYCSQATARLLPLVMEDALGIGFTRDRDLVDTFLRLLERRLVPLPYGRRVAIPNSDFSVRLQPAGHILGSAYAVFDSRSTGRRILFSGDLGAPYSPLLPAPKPPYRADVLVLESTYGDRVHEGRRDRRERLRQIIERCLADRGVVLIPAFSIGRTQELLYEFEAIIHRDTERLAARGLPWSELDIVVDSPLAARFTKAYRSLRQFWDQEARRRLSAGRHPLAFEQLTTIDSHADHLRVVDYLRGNGRPTVVIAGSGMCTGGRIVNYLKALLGDARTDVVFVGYQAAGTPGRDIQQYGPRGGWVLLEGERYPIRAKVHTVSGYSAHADQANLVNFVRRMRRRPAEIRLVHGERAARGALALKLAEVVPEARIVLPGNVVSGGRSPVVVG